MFDDAGQDAVELAWYAFAAAAVITAAFIARRLQARRRDAAEKTT